MTVKHEHETWINTLMSKIRLFAQLERLKQYNEDAKDPRSVEKYESYVEEATKLLADIENSTYLKLDEVDIEARHRGERDSKS